MEEQKKINRYKFHVIITFFIIIFCTSIVAPKTLQNDTFYTVKVGEYIAQNGIGNLNQDPFSWIELPYTFPHWLYDLGMYGIHQLGGWTAIYLSTIILTSVLGISIYFTSNKISKNAPLSAIITFIAMYLMRPYVAARAQLVTFTLMILSIYLIEKYLEKAKKRYAIGLILMSLLIVNLHMAVWPFFFVIFLPYIAEYILSLDIFTIDLIIKLKIYLLKVFSKENTDTKIKELQAKIKHNEINRKKARENPYKIRITRNDNMKKLILVMIICMFMGLITPTGLSTPYTYLAKTMVGNTVKVINEHLPLDLPSNQEFVAFFVAFIVVLTFIDIKIDFKHLCYYLGILYLALNSRRQVSMFLVICTPILAKLIGEIFERYAPELQEKTIKLVNNFYCKVALTTVFIVVGIQGIKEKINESYYYPQDYPIYATNWIKENLDYKNIKLFNEYNYGSYLVYSGIPVMIDSRADLYSPEFNTKTKNVSDGNDIFMDVQNIATGKDDYKKIFENYGVTHVITYSDSRVSKKLKSNSDYKKIYPLTEEESALDERFVIYEKVQNN
ncbi:MAG: hypothetical protein HFJ44_02425 [Clostridia bacterium]|jgi:hypothetical protein|nr:hypothetical protein [Clostridia bacterium]